MDRFGEPTAADFRALRGVVDPQVKQRAMGKSCDFEGALDNAPEPAPLIDVKGGRRPKTQGGDGAVPDE